METPMDRIFKAAGCRTQTELAELLGIRQSSISDAKRRGSVPAEWLLTLLRIRGINPEWVLSGSGPRELLADGGLSASPRENAISYDATIRRNILRCFPSQDLSDELLRRAGTSRQPSFSQSG